VFGVITDAMTWLRENGIPAAKDVISILFQGEYTGGLFEAFGIAEDSPFVDFLFRVREAAQQVGTFITGTLIPALQSFGGWMVDNKDWLLALVSAAGAAVLAWQAWTTAITVWQGITKAAAAVQAAFNVVMNANPIM